MPNHLLGPRPLKYLLLENETPAGKDSLSRIITTGDWRPGNCIWLPLMVMPEKLFLPPESAIPLLAFLRP